jgi:hypothetical protein
MEVQHQSKLNDLEGLRLLHLKLVGKVALITGISAAIILFILVFVVSENSSGNYREIIQAYSITRAHLSAVMILAALLLVILVGLSVGLIALYASFRVAGPLYRVSRNLQTSRSLAHQLGIRREDALHATAGELRESVNSLVRHYQQLRAGVGTALTLAEQSHVDPVLLSATISELKALESSVRLDG